MSLAITTREARAAIAYATRGWSIFPCALDKRPLTGHGHRDASCDLERVRAWWAAHPHASIGWALPRDLFALDIDPRHGGHDSLAKLEREHGRLPVTLSQMTGGGGEHRFFRVPSDVEIRQLAGLRDGLDTRAPGRGYVLLAPSRHPSGRRYRWGDRVPPVAPPGWLVDLVRVRPPVIPAALVAPIVETVARDRAERYAEAALQGEASAVASTAEGGRNHRLFAAWRRCHDPEVAQHLPADHVRAVLTQAARAAGLGAAEINRTLREVVAA